MINQHVPVKKPKKKKKKKLCGSPEKKKTKNNNNNNTEMSNADKERGGSIRRGKQLKAKGSSVRQMPKERQELPNVTLKGR